MPSGFSPQGLQIHLRLTDAVARLIDGHGLRFLGCWLSAAWGITLGFFRLSVKVSFHDVSLLGTRLSGIGSSEDEMSALLRRLGSVHSLGQLGQLPHRNRGAVESTRHGTRGIQKNLPKIRFHVLRSTLPQPFLITNLALIGFVAFSRGLGQLHVKASRNVWILALRLWKIDQLWRSWRSVTSR